MRIKIYFKKNNNEQGAILLLSLIIATGILMAALTLGIVIVGSLQRATLAAGAIKAYYMAESGMEKSLYLIRKKDQVLLAGGCSLDFPPSDFNCSLAVDNKIEAEFSYIAENNSEQAALVDAAGGIAANIDSIRFRCADGNGSGAIAWLEATLVPLSSWQVSPSTTPTLKFLGSCGAATTTSFIRNDPKISESYIMRLKALYADAKAVSAQAFTGPSATGSPVPLGKMITLRSAGRYKSANQLIKVEIPDSAAAASYFDYVLFSEESIDKEQPEGGGGGNSNGGGGNGGGNS